jgi:hypothetical protein
LTKFEKSNNIIRMKIAITYSNDIGKVTYIRLGREGKKARNWLMHYFFKKKGRARKISAIDNIAYIFLMQKVRKKEVEITIKNKL